MIITEIKHLNVRISEFEDPIFDKNILPVFTTPLILKEVAARKKSKYKIETLNPEKKLTFRIVSFYEIVEQLAARINKIALNLEPHYFIDPSDSYSLPYNVREILENKNLIDETKEIAEAVLRIRGSSVKGKKLILYARSPLIESWLRLSPIKGQQYAAFYSAKLLRSLRVRRQALPYRYGTSPLKSTPLLKKKYLFKYRSGAIINFKNYDLLMQSLAQPYQPRLKNISSAGYAGAAAPLYLRSRSAGWYRRGVSSELLEAEKNFTNLNKKTATMPNQSQDRKPYLDNASLEKIKKMSRIGQNLAPLTPPTEAVQLNKDEAKLSKNIVLNRSTASYATTLPLLLSGWIPTSKGALMLLEDEGWDLDLLSNKNNVSLRLKKRRPYSLRKLRRLRRLRRLRLMSINLYLHRSKNVEIIQKNQNCQGRNHSKLNSNPNIAKALNNKHLIKHNDNKLNFIINWIGGNLALSRTESSVLQKQELDRRMPAAQATQRLDKKNISDIFLAQAYSDSQPIQLSSLELQKNIESIKITNAPRPNHNIRKKVSVKTSLHKAPDTNKSYYAKNRKFATLASSILTISNTANAYVAATSCKGVSQSQASSVNVAICHTLPVKMVVGKATGAQTLLSPIKRQSQSRWYSAVGSIVACALPKVGLQRWGGLIVTKATKYGELAAVAQIQVLIQHRAASTVAGNGSNNMELSGSKKLPKAKRKVPASPMAAGLSPTALSEGRLGPASFENQKQSGKAKSLFKQERLKAKTATLPFVKAEPAKSEKPIDLASAAAHIKSINSSAHVKSFNRSTYKPTKLVQPTKIEKSANSTYFSSGSHASANGLFTSQTKQTIQAQLTQQGLHQQKNVAKKEVAISTIQSLRSRAPQVESTISTKQFKQTVSKVVSWKKKKRLLAFLLNKTSQNFANSLLQRRKLYLEDNFTGNIKKYRTEEKKLASELKFNFLNKIRTGYSVVAYYPSVLEEERFVFDKAALPAQHPWKKISSLLNYGVRDGATAKPGLFWAVIKLYSSLFNPMLNSLNNKYLTLPGLTGNGTAKLKILKNTQANVASGAPISPQENSLKSLPPHMVNLLLSYLNSELNTISEPFIGKAKTAKTKRRQEVIYATQLGRIAKIKEQILALSVIAKEKKLKAKQRQIIATNKRAGCAAATSARLTLKKTVAEGQLRLPALPGQQAEKTKPMLALNKFNKGWQSWHMPSHSDSIISNNYSPHKSSSNLPARAYTNLRKAAANSVGYASQRADNKRFLFLYFIVPIFFATLKNSTAMPARLAGRTQALPATAPNFQKKNLNNQKKQLRSLIKLMLASGSVLRSQWQNKNLYLCESNSCAGYVNASKTRIAENPKVPFPAMQGQNMLAKTSNTNISAYSKSVAAEPTQMVLKKNINNLVEAFNFLITKKKKNTASAVEANKSRYTRFDGFPRIKNSAALDVLQAYANAEPVQQTATELLKWSVLLIAQSLAPLKRKQEYFSFIFIKILETRGFLAFKNKTNALLNPEAVKSATPYSNASQKEAVAMPQHKAAVAYAGTESKPASITFYPGGRFISDWKRVTKVIWQEEYKFNAAYWRVKNSLNLANININKNLKNWYAIITILRLWDVVKIRSIKFVYLFKLQVLFLKYGCFTYFPRKKGYNNTPSSANKGYGVIATTFFPTFNRAASLRFRTVALLREMAVKKKIESLRPLRPLRALRRRKKARPLNNLPLRTRLLAKLNKNDIILRADELLNAWTSLWIDKLIFTLIETILKVLEKMPVIGRYHATHLKRIATQNSTVTTMFESRGLDGLNAMQASLTNKSNLVTQIARATQAKKKKQKFNFNDNFFIWLKLKKNPGRTALRIVPTSTSLSFNLIRLFKYLVRRVEFYFYIDRLEPYKKLAFISKDVKLALTPATPMAMPLLPCLALAQAGTQLYKEATAPNVRDRVSVANTNLPEQIVGQAIDSLRLNTEFKKSFNNLVNAKSTIIGKIRSIKLIELIDKMKEEIIIAEKLAALVRVADITDLNLINKKQFRRINASKYLNKKNIYRSNRIKILQTIKTIKTDLRFEPKLDSNSLSNIPVGAALLYYSNLKPISASYDGYNHTAPLRTVKPSTRLPQEGYTPVNEKNNAALQPAPTRLAYLGRDLEENLIKEGSAAQVASVTQVNAEVEKPPVLSAYLRELSIYNRETKGTINYFSKIVGYNFNTNTNKISSSITDLLAASFKAMRCLISKPVFVITPEKITIQLFYFLLVATKTRLKKVKKKLRYNNNERLRKIYKKSRLYEAKKFHFSSLNEVFPKQFELLCGRLNKEFNKPVELNLIRLHYPSEDSNILANLMGLIIHKTRLYYIFRKIFAGSIIKSLIKLKARKFNDITIIPAFLTGLNIKVAGRLMTQPIRPRKTINQTRRGASASGKINYLNYARLTKKNKRGSFSITIAAGQNYFK